MKSESCRRREDRGAEENARHVNAERRWKVEVIHDESLKSVFQSRGGRKNWHSFSMCQVKVGHLFDLERGRN